MQLIKKKRQLLLMTLWVILCGTIPLNSGCSLLKEYVLVSKRLPILPKPTRPILTPISGSEIMITGSLRWKLVERDKALKKYAKKLEIAIDLYNDFARKTNDQSKIFDPLKEIK